MTIDVFTLAQEDTRLEKVSVREYAGPCPGCKGDDRFHVNLSKRDTGGFMCRYCWPADEKGWGDAIAYLCHFRGMSFTEAKDYLAGEVDTVLERVQKLRKQTLPPEPVQGQPPGEAWQKRVSIFADEAQARLHAPEGQTALDYLRSRGLTDETIRRARLGYAVRNHAPCVVIPWYADGVYWRLNLRDIRPDVPEKKRYRNMPGSTNYGLYAGDSLKFRRPVFLVEDEFSALSIAQEAGDIVSVVATGGIDGSQTPKWIGRLARVPTVFVAYDSDTPGDKAAKDYWLKWLVNALRWRPLAHDANDMLREGDNIRSWVQAALDYVSEPVVTPAPLSQIDFRCSLCHADLNASDQDARIDENEIAYCLKCYSEQQQQKTPYTSYEHFLEGVQVIVTGLNERTGVQWAVIPLSPGYTLEHYLADRRQQELEEIRQKQRAYQQSRLKRVHTRAG